MQIRRTGRSMLDSHDAALIMCEMWSMFHMISSRLRIPRIVWIRPTAWYGSTIATLLLRGREDCTPPAVQPPRLNCPAPFIEPLGRPAEAHLHRLAGLPQIAAPHPPRPTTPGCAPSAP